MDGSFCNDLCNQLLREFHVQDRGGVYGMTSRTLAYHSNAIEGSSLSEEDTISLFETNSVVSSDDKIYRSKDIEEMNGHFLMFNKMLQTLDEPLSITLIKKFHYELQIGVFEYRANGYVAGEFKRLPNRVSNIVTARPGEAAAKMKELLNSYHSKEEKTLEDILHFHVLYERIHPFQDGNGRTGRLIMFRECLKNNVMPFVIECDKKAEYYLALKRYDEKPGMFIDFVKKEQDIYRQKASFFLSDRNIEDVEYN